MTKTYKGIYKAVIAVGNSLEERVPDRKGIGQKDYLVTNFGLAVDELTISKLWIVEAEKPIHAGNKNESRNVFPELLWRVAEGMLVNPVVHACSIYKDFDVFGKDIRQKDTRYGFNEKFRGDWILRYGFKTEPFVSDVEGDFVKKAIEEVLGIRLNSLRSATQYTLAGRLNEKDLEIIANQSPIDSKCHKVVYFPLVMDDMEAMQSPISREHSRVVFNPRGSDVLVYEF